MPDRPLPTDSDGSFPNRVAKSTSQPISPEDDQAAPLLDENGNPPPVDPLKADSNDELPAFPRAQLPPKPSPALAEILARAKKTRSVSMPAKGSSSVKYSTATITEALELQFDKLPFISVVVAAPPNKEGILSVKSSREFQYPYEKFEIILARGKQPSVQRNKAVKEAKGSLIYFLDDDSVPSIENLILGVERFKDAQVQVVGGPNLVPPDCSRLERAFGEVMGSWLAFGPSQSRYRKIGKTRESGEKELILCNMMFRKSAFEEHGGFDEALYPNEENALMDAIQNGGGKLIYDPDFFVHRRPRQSLGAFCKMLMNYGRGRAEQFRLHPTLGSAPNFVPPAFLLYLLATPFLPVWALWPLSVYTLAVVMQVVALDPIVFFSLPRLAPLIFMSHLFYGAGFIKGLFTRLKPKDQPSEVEVVLERISPA